MRPHIRLLALVALTASFSTKPISSFSFEKKLNAIDGGLKIPSAGLSKDLAAAAAAAGLSQKHVTTSSNNQFMSYPTRRETIKMPSQTPMVPWTVRCSFLL